MRQQIVHLKNKVVENTPDETRLKVLEDSVTTHEKGQLNTFSNLLITEQTFQVSFFVP